MRGIVLLGLVAGAVLLLSGARIRAGEHLEGELLSGQPWRTLALVTGVHSIRIKKAGLEAKLLEADGPEPVDRNPVDLYLVVTNNTKSDRIERVWRLPQSVARVHHVASSDCGIDVAVEVDPTAVKATTGPWPRTLRLCFLSRAGKLDTALKVTEVDR